MGDAVGQRNCSDTLSRLKGIETFKMGPGPVSGLKCSDTLSRLKGIETHSDGPRRMKLEVWCSDTLSRLKGIETGLVVND